MITMLLIHASRIGSIWTRKNKAMKPKFSAHKTSEVPSGAVIGSGTKIWNNSQILKGAIIGNDCVIGHNCLVSSKAKLGRGVKLEANIDVWDLVELGDFVFVGPSAVFTNDLNPRAKYPKSQFPEYGEWLPTIVKEGASIGANATILCGNTVGKWAMVGAGSVVTRDVPDYAIAVGVPARVLGWACECGRKIVFKRGKALCDICSRAYKKEDFKVWNF